MRVRIIFTLKNRGASLPFHHQYLISRLITEMLEKAPTKEYLDYELFNFSGLKGQTTVSKSGLQYYSSKVTLVLAAYHKEFVDYFLKELFRQSLVELGDLILKPDFVELEHIPKLENPNKYVMISPLVLLNPAQEGADEAKRFINPEADEFSDLIYDSTMIRLENSGFFNADEMAAFYKFQLVADKKYLQKIRANQKKFARIYPVYENQSKLEVRGYTFPFTLFADVEVQKFIFINGFGMFTKKGFGMIDIANSDPRERTELYEFQQ